MEWNPIDHRDVIDTVWPDFPDYVKAIKSVDATARAHHVRNSIPSDYWPLVCAVAHERGFSKITEGLLAKLKKPRKRSDRAQNIMEAAAA
jgi:hypothetical protein